MKNLVNLEKIIKSVKSWFISLSGDQKKKLILACTAAFAFILTIAVVISISATNNNDTQAQPERLTVIFPIPVDEIFLPDEPDFLPDVLLERERRLYWSEQDASEYWQDPLRSGEETWRVMIETSIDDLLERVQ
ncbi:MAG: hypothetical protein FWC21_06885 [Treponema sp.]|nr:hypothetical protein [Treponema sp.]